MKRLPSFVAPAVILVAIAACTPDSPGPTESRGRDRDNNVDVDEPPIPLDLDHAGRKWRQSPRQHQRANHDEVERRVLRDRSLCDYQRQLHYPDRRG